MSKFLGIDSSTQSMTALIIDFEKETIIAEESINFDEHFGDQYDIKNGTLELRPGEIHSPPLLWLDALDLLFETLHKQGHILSSVNAISGSGQQHGTVYLNKTVGNVLADLDAKEKLSNSLSGVFSRNTAPIWMDSSTTKQCGEIEAAVGGREALLDLTGNTAFERFSGPQIRKYSQLNPVGYERTTCICLVSSFLASVLAGRLVGVDAGDGSGTNLMNIRTRLWSPKALEATAPNLTEKLLPITGANPSGSALSPYFITRYGFSTDCQVFPFSGDNPCSMIGLGLVEPGQVALSLGTSDTLFACLDKPRTSATREGAVFASPDGDNYMALVCFMNGSLARESVRNQFGLSWEEFTASLQRTQAGNDGSLMLPYFFEEIVPHVAKPGVIRQNLDANDVDTNVRAVVEAQALTSRIHSEWMQTPVSSLSVTGGASENTEILKIYSNVHGCPVRQFATTNSAALGAALSAAHSYFTSSDLPRSWSEIVSPFTRASSTLHPDGKAQELYNERVEAYRQLERHHSEEIEHS